MSSTELLGPKVVLVAGGTGGHIFPALAVARELAARGMAPVFLTDSRGMQYLADIDDMPCHVLTAADPRSGVARALVQLPQAVSQASKVLGDIAPIAVIGFGGYATLAVMIAARLRGMPTCLHEQNAVLGRVNRLMARFVGAVALSYEHTALVPASAHKRAQVTGNPVRAPFLNKAASDYTPHERGQEFRLLVIGGSQGAAIFSEVVPAALRLLPISIRGQISLTQQCRPETLDDVQRQCDDAGIRATLSSFFDDLDARLFDAHLVIGRSGASTISEAEVCGRPAILVPLPYAMDDHQTANAQPLAEQGAAWLVPQGGFTAEKLAAMLQDLIEHPENLSAASSALRRRARPDAAPRVADLVESLSATTLGTAGHSAAKQEEGANDAPHVHSSWAIRGAP
jgi:UDP-N-acetylglucosamine--N-acetylmuramyl-(pentapeptide) pyrophosphoryl-undecaprenol N-acetylglucosamine transferase